MNEKNVREVAERNMILKFPVGSKLYGTDTPESDEDFCGVFVAPKRYYLGLDKVEEVDFNIISKKDNGRNDKDAVDFKMYELRKFVRLALDNNPNIIEMLFVPEHRCNFVHPIGRRLLEARHLFPHVGAKQKFMGYSLSQRKKMFVKRDNMLSILYALKVFKDINPKDYLAEHLLMLQTSFDKTDHKYKDKGQHIQIGDMMLQKNDTFKQAIRKLEDRSERFSSRYDDFVSKHGYDTKFASHLIRLLSEGFELLKTGEIKFPLYNSDLIRGIKFGHYSIEEVLDMSDRFEEELNELVDSGDFSVPKKPRINEVEALLIELVEDSWEHFSF